VTGRDRRRRLAAAITVAVAVVSLVSAVSPPLRSRLETLLGLTDFVVPQSAAALTALVGAILLVVARGLRRGSRLAWVGALVLLGLLIVLHLVKGIDVEESVIAAVAGAWLATQRRAFPVMPSRAAVLRAVAVAVGGGALAVLLSVSATVALGHRHHPRPDETAREAAERLVGLDAARRAHVPPGVLPGVGPAAAPILPVAGAGLAIAGLWLLFTPSRAPRLSPDDHRRERERVRRIVAEHGNDTLAWFALRDDKDWFLYGSTVVAHAVRGQVCLVSPDPIGPAHERADAWAGFRAYAERNGWSVVVVAAAPDQVPVYEADGMRAVYLGDEAILDCTTFTLEGSAMKGLRQACSRVARAGVTFDFLDPSAVTWSDRAAIQLLSLDSRRGDAERGFSMTLGRLFDRADTGLLMTVARNSDGEPVGFLQWVPGPDVDGWSLDVMRRSTREGVPNGLMEAAIAATASHVREAGGHGLALNFAVFRTLAAGEVPGPLGSVGREVVQRVGQGSQIESLRAFNEKFRPRWRPRYVVVDAVDMLIQHGISVARAEGVVSEMPGVRMARRSRNRTAIRAAARRPGSASRPRP
jgi:lysyl-tRNA synthetase class 2